MDRKIRKKLGENPLAYLWAACGLSYSEAAEFHNVADSSIAHWGRSTRPVPDGIWREILNLHSKILSFAIMPIEDISDDPDFKAMPHGARQMTNALRMAHKLEERAS